MAKIATTDFAFPIVFNVPFASAVDTLSFEQVQPQTSINDKLGWILHRAEWFLPHEAAQAFLNADAPFTLEVGISNSNSFTTPQSDNPAIKWRSRWTGAADNAISTGTGRNEWVAPFVSDLSTLPGGGILMLPYPLFGFTNIRGTIPTGIATVSTFFRLYVSQVQLSDSDFFAMLQANQLLISS